MHKFFTRIKHKILLFVFQYIGAILPQYVAHIAFSIFTTPRRHHPKLSDRKLLAKAIGVYEEFEGDAVIGYKFGSSAKIVILVHGWSSHALSMRNFIPSLLANGYSVLSFDAPAHGKSAGKNLDAMKYTRFLQYIFSKYEPYGVIAHSIGGSCSLFAIARSGLGDKIVKKVVIAAPIGAITPIHQFIHGAKLNKKVITQFYNIIYKLINKYLLDKRMLNFAEAYTDGLDFSGLIIHDANDSVISYKEAEELHATLPNASLLITHKLGHLSILKSPIIVDVVVKYLSTSDN